MSRLLLWMAVLALSLGTWGASAHEDHEIDRELLASKIRERGYPCTSVSEAEEKGGSPMVMAVKCADDHAYRLEITATDFQVSPVPSPNTAP